MEFVSVALVALKFTVFVVEAFTVSEFVVELLVVEAFSVCVLRFVERFWTIFVIFVPPTVRFVTEALLIFPLVVKLFVTVALVKVALDAFKFEILEVEAFTVSEFVVELLVVEAYEFSAYKDDVAVIVPLCSEFVTRDAIKAVRALNTEAKRFVDVASEKVALVAFKLFPVIVPVAVRSVVAIFEVVAKVILAFTAVRFEPVRPGAEKLPVTARLVAVALVRVALVAVRFVKMAVSAERSEEKRLVVVAFVNVALVANKLLVLVVEA